MCQVNITQVIGSSTSSGIDITITGTSSDCQNVRVRFNAGGVWAPDQFVNVGTGGMWSTTFNNLPHSCGDNYEAEACCVDANGEIIANCCDSTGGTIECEDNCCINPNISIEIGECDTNGKRPVTFTINAVVNNGNCLPFVFYLDFGDGTNSPTQLINMVGTHTTTLTHLYDTISALNYIATLHQTFPTGCPSLSIPVTLDPCILDCCPDVDVQIQVKACNDQCKREVEVISTFTPPSPNCPYASMQWTYYDGNNNFIAYGQSFNNLMSSPHIDTVYFTSTQSPVTAKLIIQNPPLDCPEIIKTITIPDCNGCPEITSFTSTIKECIKKGNSCCRKIEFEIKGIFCGNPKIRIEYGDGNYDEQIVQNQGMQTIYFDNEYCTDGNYTVILKTITPTGCPSRSLNITVPKCNPDECGTVTDPEPTKPDPFCPCCILLLLSIIAYFTLWATGLYEETITILGTTLNAGGLAGGLFALLIVLATLCYWLNPKCDCPKCRYAKCLMWASIIAMLLIIIMVLVTLLTPLTLVSFPQWILAIISAFVLFLVARNIHRSDTCKTFWETGKCE